MYVKISPAGFTNKEPFSESWTLGNPSTRKTHKIKKRLATVRERAKGTKMFTPRGYSKL